MTMQNLDVFYPVRPEEPDCAYYMRTGACGFGINCKFNHPPDHKPGRNRTRADHPERPGQPECQYYLKTGTCKFGAACKYHHPQGRASLLGRAQLNILGLPLRLEEEDCGYYLRTGHCKFGVSCKFNHPEPLIMPSSPIFPTPALGSPLNTQPSYQVGLAPFPTVSSTVPYLPHPQLQDLSGFAPVLLPSPQAVAMWNVYQGQQQGISTSYMVSPGVPPQHAATGLYSPYMPIPGSMRPTSPSTSGSREALYPERPGQQDCQYYMRTGECRFGAQCRFHHPKDRSTNSHQVSAMSPTGLPIRPGAPPCTFFIRYGYCKFGPACKFDHPFGPTVYPSNLGAISVAQYEANVPISPALDTASFSRNPLELPKHPSLEESDATVSSIHQGSP